MELFKSNKEGLATVSSITKEPAMLKSLGVPLELVFSSPCAQVSQEKIESSLNCAFGQRAFTICKSSTNNWVISVE